jgi:cytochrome c peroxidase
VKKIHLKYVVLFSVIIALTACRDRNEAPDPIDWSGLTTPYNLVIPAYFPPMDIPADNPLTVEGVELGRYLFWEKKLSGNNTQSCGSCHLPQHGFSDPNQFSMGITGELGNRQAMTLANLGWAYNFFWDGRSPNLEDQVIHPVTNPIEMNESWDNALQELRNDPIYPPLFFKAYGSEEITQDKAAKAMASFLRTMISSESKFDKERRGEYTFTPLEDAGFNLFITEGGMNANTGQPWGGADCFHCHGHAGMQMGDYLMHNNGIDDSFENDPGRAGVTGNPLDSGKFKTPSLRNIEVTGPYMHDGRFTDLNQVLDHYNTGGKISTTIDPFMEAAGGGLYLDDLDKLALIEFLKTLTDTEFMQNPAFSDPH